MRNMREAKATEASAECRIENFQFISLQQQSDEMTTRRRGWDEKS